MKYTFGSGESLSKMPNFTYSCPSRKGAQPTLLTVANCMKVSASGTEVAPSSKFIA